MRLRLLYRRYIKWNTFKRKKPRKLGKSETTTTAVKKSFIA